MKIFVILSFLLVLAVHSSLSARILFFLPIASKSHANVFEPLTRALADRGHDIVNLSPVKLKNVPSNIEQIQIFSVEEIYKKINPFEMRKMGKFQTMLNGGWNFLTTVCEKIIRTEKFQNFVKTEKFDLVIVHILANYCTLGAIPYFDAPTIMYSTFPAPYFVADRIGNRPPPSFVPNVMLPFTHNMTFMQRMMNTLGESVSPFLFHVFFKQPAEELYRKYLPNGKDLPGMDEIIANTSMVFSNSHYTLTYPRPLLPDSIEVGGMHARPAKPLPKDIDDFLKGSGDDGFIFFSLGSVVQANEMPEEYRKIFVNVLSKLKQRVIWKWETETMPDLPKNSNILLKKWLPQQDILGHPNIKLFMTHGGLLSTQEAVYHGVPLLGFPIFGDQDLNVKQAESTGYAKYFEILELSEEKLESAIKEVLNNPSYSMKAKDLSKVVKDLPQTPLEKAIFWSEYVIRNKGAPYLRSAARDLNFFQYYVLDVLAVLLIIASIFSYLIYAILRCTIRKLCGRKSVKNVDKLKKAQ